MFEYFLEHRTIRDNLLDVDIVRLSAGSTLGVIFLVIFVVRCSYIYYLFVGVREARGGEREFELLYSSIDYKISLIITLF